jgi:hypothetical protein
LLSTCDRSIWRPHCRCSCLNLGAWYFRHAWEWAGGWDWEWEWGWGWGWARLTAETASHRHTTVCLIWLLAPLRHCAAVLLASLHGFEFPRSEVCKVLQRHRALPHDLRPEDAPGSLLSVFVESVCARPHVTECGAQTDPLPEPSLCTWPFSSRAGVLHGAPGYIRAGCIPRGRGVTCATQLEFLCLCCVPASVASVCGEVCAACNAFHPPTDQLSPALIPPVPFHHIQWPKLRLCRRSKSWRPRGLRCELVR